MPDPKCNICEKRIGNYYLRIEGKRYDNGSYYRLYKCNECELAFLYPQPEKEKLVSIYSSNYEPHTPKNVEQNYFKKRFMPKLQRLVYSDLITPYEDEKLDFKRLLSYFLEVLSYRSLPYHVENGRLLDVGCGVGTYLNKIRELGWNPYGVETSIKAAEYAKNNLQLSVKIGNFEKIEYTDNYFDIITMWHSLEHFKNPQNALIKAYMSLKTGGRIMLGIPNYGSLDRRIFRESWNGYEIPLHLFHYTRKSIKKTLKKAGFKDIKIVDTIRPQDMIKSMQNYTVDRFNKNISIIYMPMVLLISIALSTYCYLLRKPSIIKVYARK